ncbi:hypothetical protein BGW38_006419 [Lunasporangiospora selenospora]|uniref:Uncharacterized protein n=1 Tax=Lunasporangiospora selenospora TaxID=979761 RepID=A0A9P6KIP2_9FUNG|nr:hypothetical protein BGW38_006419 [Lunasporangiospora selenospora]
MYFAITLREAYRELWPYFLLADEDSEPTQDQVDNLVMRRRKRQRSVKLRRDRIRQRRQQGAQCPQINQGQEMQNDNPDGGQSPSSSKNDRDIEQSSGDKGKNIANDEDEAERFREKARLVSMAGRFTTSFEASLRHHKVIIDRRRITDAEACRAECLARRGWNIDRYGVDGQEDETVPADEEEEDEDEDEDEEDEDEEDEDGDDGDDDGDNQDQDELSTNGVAGGKRVIKKVRQGTDDRPLFP